MHAHAPHRAGPHPLKIANVEVIKRTSVKIGRSIGKGAFGIVLKGVWVEPGMPVACKQIAKANFPLDDSKEDEDNDDDDNEEEEEIDEWWSGSSSGSAGRGDPSKNRSWKTKFQIQADRERERDQRFIKEVIHECNILGSLHHPSLLNLYGIVIQYKDEHRQERSPHSPSVKPQELGISELEKNLEIVAWKIDSIYLITELCNTTLTKRLGSLSWSLRQDTFNMQLECLVQIGSGMEYLHANGIVHRDLKPDNVLLSTSDPKKIICKIIDYGLSYKFDNLDENERKEYVEDSDGVGTLVYMAPEMLINDDKALHSHPFACDSYSYGILAYNVLTYNMDPYKDKHTPPGKSRTFWLLASIGLGMRPDIIQGIARRVSPDASEEEEEEEEQVKENKLITAISTQTSSPTGELYRTLITLIRSCWMEEAEWRPTFKHIKNELNKLIQSNSNMPTQNNPIHVSGL